MNFYLKNGIGTKYGAFTPSEQCKISNRFIPNKRVYCLFHLDAKVFCGNFSRDGKYFMTASQGINYSIDDKINNSNIIFVSRAENSAV